MNTKNSLTHTKRYKTLISALHSIYRLINSTYEKNEFIFRLAKIICQIFNVKYCMISLLDPSNRYSLLKCTVTNNKKFGVNKKNKVTSRLEKKIIRTLSCTRKNYLLAAPLISEDLMGMIIIKRRKDTRPFDIFDQDMLMAIVEEVTIALRNLQLYEEHQRMALGTIKSLVTMLDTRIPREYTHSPYFSRLVTSIAQQMHLDERQTESLKYASLLHDAGKVDIPLEILTKTTKLTPNEYSIIKRHPVEGARMLRHLQIIKPVIPIIMHHHEKYDGTGYPSRLKKGQIPQGARIMSVADAFEAMVYGRPYRERKDIASAIKEIRKKSGTQFDPRVVEAFLKVIKKAQKKYLQLPKEREYNKR